MRSRNARPRIIDGSYRGYICCAVDVSEAHLAGEASERRVAERTRELTEQIAERQRVEAALHQMQRLEAVGQLPSGVAHDFNNLLTVVLGNIAMLERTLGETADARDRQRLEHVRMAAERGAALTAQLLAFSRRQRLEAKVVELNQTIAGMRELMESTLGRAITIDMRLADELWHALVDPTQFELVVLNLAINARDAMGTAGGTLHEPGTAHVGHQPERRRERQVEERPQLRLHLGVEILGDGGAGHGAGHAVGGEGVARAAVEIARKLVEADDQGQGPFRRRRPVVVFAPRAGVVHRLEAQPDRLVE